MGQKDVSFFGAALVIVRRRVGLSRYRLARITGFSDQYLRKLEHLKCDPRAQTILRLGRGLGVSPGDLLNEMDSLMKEYQESGEIPQIIREIMENGSQKPERKAKYKRLKQTL